MLCMLYFGNDYPWALESSYITFCSGDLLNAVMPEVPVLGFIAIMGFGEIILSWLRSLRYVAFTSILGDISLLLGM